MGCHSSYLDELPPYLRSCEGESAERSDGAKNSYGTQLQAAVTEPRAVNISTMKFAKFSSAHRKKTHSTQRLADKTVSVC